MINLLPWQQIVKSLVQTLSQSQIEKPRFETGAFVLNWDFHIFIIPSVRPSQEARSGLDWPYSMKTKNLAVKYYNGQRKVASEETSYWYMETIFVNYSKERNHWPDCSVGRKMAMAVQLHYHTKESHQLWASSGNSILLTFYLVWPSFQLVLQTDCW